MNKGLFKQAAAGAALAMAFGAAQAATFAEGTLDVYGTNNFTQVAHVAAGSFTDYFTFSLVQTGANSASSAVALDLGTLFDMTGTLSLFQGSTPGSGTLIGGGWAFNGTSGSTSHSVLLTSGGDYYLQATGTATGSGGGNYLVSLNVAPVPEPETYALMMAGLGLMGFVARRRKQQGSAA